MCVVWLKVALIGCLANTVGVFLKNCKRLTLKANVLSLDLLEKLL